MNSKSGNRVACCGASGTGKTLITSHVADRYALPINPVGSRSVAADMGFASPYDADKVGRRDEFQARLLSEKMQWEAQHDAFVTDRSVLDNLAYSMLHGTAVEQVSSDTLHLIEWAMRHYTHLVYCPVDVFCNLGDDPTRMQNMAYHKLYDALLVGLLDRFGRGLPRLSMRSVDIGDRLKTVDLFLEL